MVDRAVFFLLNILKRGLRNVKNYFDLDLQKAHEIYGHICTGIILVKEVKDLQ